MAGPGTVSGGVICAPTDCDGTFPQDAVPILCFLFVKRRKHACGRHEGTRDPGEEVVERAGRCDVKQCRIGSEGVYLV